MRALDHQISSPTSYRRPFSGRALLGARNLHELDRALLKAVDTPVQCAGRISKIRMLVRRRSRLSADVLLCLKKRLTNRARLFSVSKEILDSVPGRLERQSRPQCRLAQTLRHRTEIRRSAERSEKAVTMTMSSDDRRTWSCSRRCPLWHSVGEMPSMPWSQSAPR